MKNFLISTQKNPYYIYAPAYTKKSMGIKILHYLCHYLNTKGYPAFLFDSNMSKYKINTKLISPILTVNIINCHREQNLSPIAIYPDVVNGNPLNCNNVVRYLLNYPGLLGGPKEFEQNDLIYSYTKKISDRVNHSNKHILFIPPLIDSKIFYPPISDTKRTGGCYYASKYKEFHKQKTLPFTDNLIEITRDKENSQTTEEIGELFRKSEFFATYEDTSLITESLLCGCPVILIENKFFDGSQLAEHELTSLGSTKKFDRNSIEKATNEIPLFIKNYNNSFSEFENQIASFIKDTQNLSLNKNFPKINDSYIIKLDSFNKYFKKKFKKLIKKILKV